MAQTREEKNHKERERKALRRANMTQEEIHQMNHKKHERAALRRANMTQEEIHQMNDKRTAKRWAKRGVK